MLKLPEDFTDSGQVKRWIKRGYGEQLTHYAACNAVVRAINVHSERLGHISSNKPTAWAYAQACRSSQKYKEQVSRLVEENKTLRQLQQDQNSNGNTDFIESLLEREERGFLSPEQAVAILRTFYGFGNAQT